MLIVSPMPGSERLLFEGRVAVLISPGYGSGWSTWAKKTNREAMLFDAQIADVMLDHTLTREQRLAQARTLAELKYPGEYLGGLDALEVALIDPGARFVINEVDGYESITLAKDIEWIQA